MLDIKFVRENMEAVRKAIADKNEQAELDRFAELDAARRELLRAVEQLKNKRNTVSAEIARMKRKKGCRRLY